MSDAAKQALSVLRRVADFLEELPDHQIADLAEGRARLTYIPWGSSDPVKPAAAAKRAPATKAQPSTVDARAVSAELRAATSPEEGRSILRRLTRIDDVRTVAVELGIPITSKIKRDPLVERIVEFAISSRQYGEGIRML